MKRPKIPKSMRMPLKKQRLFQLFFNRLLPFVDKKTGADLTDKKRLKNIGRTAKTGTAFSPAGTAS